VSSPERATCAGCGCLCDDIVVADGGDRLVNTCPLGDAWFAERIAAEHPLARIDGAQASLGDALEAAAALLREARSPLVYGLAGTSIEAQREAVALADALGAAVSSSGAARDGPLGAALTTAGSSTATFGEIRDRPQVVVVWRADPAATHPRLLSRLRLDRTGRPSERMLVAVGDAASATAAEADEVVELAPGSDLEALWTMRAAATGLPVGDDSPLRALVERLRAADHAAFLYGAGLATSAANVHALHALVRDLSRETHVVALALRRDGNAAGADDVLAWQTGYPAPVGLASGHPDPLAAPARPDAALVVAADAEHLGDLPVVVVDARATPTADAARVAFAPAAAGVHVAGTAHRMDGIPVALRAPLPATRPSEAEILHALRERLEAAC
jgi:formylmethanofuran dehydrogenase subunit B